MSEIIVSDPGQIERLGKAANHIAAKHALAHYRDGKAGNTLRRQDADLALFADFLQSMDIATDGPALASDPTAWRGMTWGLVAGFVQWMLQAGYATGSVNVRLSTVKTYAKLASKSDALDKLEYLQIKDVSGYSRKERKHVDEKRQSAGSETRIGAKKAHNTELSDDQARALKHQPDTPQGRRDAVLMCLLLDHGLRCGEIALLKVTDVDLKAGQLRFYRPKVDIEQTHDLSADSKHALAAWFGHDAPAVGPLLRASRKGGALTRAGMTERAITKRVHDLGAHIGVERLSAHDCRHFWATYWSQRLDRLPRGILQLQEAGGWRSLAMPRKYAAASEIANKGMV